MAININNHFFKGHKSLLGGKTVTYAELELPTAYEIFDKSKTFDWGFAGQGALQLSFAMLYKVTKDEELSKNLAQKYMMEVVKFFAKDWMLNSKDVKEWVIKNEPAFSFETAKHINITEKKPVIKQNKNRTTKRGPSKDNVVKQICKELGITQKQLAQILEVPEGTVSSWAVKNEIPRLGKKAIEFYIEAKKNEEIINSYKKFTNMLQSA